MNHPTPLDSNRGRRGQTLVEFALVLPVFLFFVMAVFDGGRAVFAFNGASQAARTVARVASVNCLGTTPRCSATTGSIKSAIDQQQVDLVGPATWTVACVDSASGTAQSDAACHPGDTVRVSVSVSISLITPVVSGAFGTPKIGSVSQEVILQ